MRHILACSLILLSLAACGVLEEGDTSSYPKTDEDRMRERLGKLTGENGISVGGPDSESKSDANNPLGVNGFLWRATLDTLAFMPLASADPFGGVIITDWFEDPDAMGERFKVNALILDRQLRSDSVKLTVFRQRKNQSNQWQDVAADPKLGRTLEDTILTRARELRVKQLGY
jgi:hypothetical protein